MRAGGVPRPARVLCGGRYVPAAGPVSPGASPAGRRCSPTSSGSLFPTHFARAPDATAARRASTIDRTSPNFRFHVEGPLMPAVLAEAAPPRTTPPDDTL